jgi:hypothetical protein
MYTVLYGSDLDWMVKLEDQLALERLAEIHYLFRHCEILKGMTTPFSTATSSMNNANCDSP